MDIIVTTLQGWGWRGGIEPGGSDDGMRITICSFFALQVCVFAELDESAAALPHGFWQNVPRNNFTLWTTFMGYIKHCAL